MKLTSLLFSSFKQKRNHSTLIVHLDKFIGLPENHPAAIEFKVLSAPILNNSYNSFHTTARYGQPIDLERLIHSLNAVELKKLVNARCSMGATPLLVATQSMIAFSNLKDITDYPYIIRMLLNCGASPNISDVLHSTTPLHNAAQGSVNVVQTLVENNALINLTDQDGNTALHLAIAANNRQSLFAANYLIDMMVKSGINPNSENISRQTPLILAKEINNAPLIEKLQNAVVPNSHRKRHILS